MVIPSASISLLWKVWRNAPKPPALPKGAVDGHLSCRFGGVNVTTQLPSGQFPNYKTLIPDGQDKRVVMDAENMALALRQVQGIASEGSGIVRLFWEGEQLRLESRGEEVGDASVTVPCVSQGEPAHIAFNLRYVLEYFSGRPGQVMLEVTTPSSPGLFTYRGMPHVLLMPVFVQWNGEPAESTQDAPKSESPPKEEEFDESTAAEAPDTTAPEDVVVTMSAQTQSLHWSRINPGASREG